MDVIVRPAPTAMPRRLAAGAPFLTVVGAVARRLLIAVVLLLAVSSLTFVLVSFTPGDAAQAILGPSASEEAYQHLRAELGLNLPLYEQYGQWLQHALTGDLGRSLFTREAVTSALANRVPVTVQLIVGALLVTALLGVPLGVAAARYRGWFARALDAISLVGFALPVFWLGAILISGFAINLRLFPPTGYVPFAESPTQWALSLVLPVFTLALHGVAVVAKQTRDSMLDTLDAEYVRMARANGIPRWSLVLRHSLKNAAIPIVTVLGLQSVWLLGGTVFVEDIFGLPGMGSLAVNATLRHDLPVIVGTVVYFTVFVIVVNAGIDLIYGALNPRIRVR